MRIDNQLTLFGPASRYLPRILRETPSSVYLWRALGIPLTVTVALLDYYTGETLRISVLYLLPISLASWKLGKSEAVLVATVSALAWLVNHAFIHPQSTGLWVPLLNSVALFGSFIAVALILSALREAIAAQQRLIEELEQALGQVKTLTGLLPMCSWCKRVRDDHGYWRAVEAYIHEHSNAEVTHGICPECRTSFFAKGKGLRDVTT